MKILRNILFSPLTFVRLFIVVFMSGYVTIIGWLWLQLFGFSKNLQRWVMQTWGNTIIFSLGIKIDKNSIPKNGNFILMPNHRSYMDIFIVAGLTPAALVGKAELKKWPFGKLAAQITNSILVDRKEIKSMIKTMHKIKTSVNQGIPVTLFPEGTTHKGPLTKTFKKGSFKIAADTGIPVIPMAIHYRDVNEAWIGKDTFLGHFFRERAKLTTKVYLRYGTPVTDADYKSLREKTQKQINTMLQEIIDSKQH